MAGRQNKVGLDYFELDCHMDEKVRLVQAEYGLKGFAVFVKLLQSIYGERGYYCEWTQDTELLFASENGLNNGSLQLLRDIVSACIRRNIFSERLFKEYGILTSAGIQKQYLKATVKREVVNLKKEYLLISVPKNNKNVVINSISDGRNSISVGRNTQSREEKSREENNIACETSASVFNIEQAWKDTFEIYPKKSGAVMAHTVWMDKLIPVIEQNRKDVAILILCATQMYIDDYKEKNPNDTAFQFIPKYENWLKNDCDYWIQQYEESQRVVTDNA